MNRRAQNIANIRQNKNIKDPQKYQWESDKLTVDTTNESQEVSPTEVLTMISKIKTDTSSSFVFEYNYKGIPQNVL